MATIKSYTDREQSKKLAEILSLESADMGWNLFVDETTRILPIDDWDLVKNGSGNVKFSPAWSLAALLDVINQVKFIANQRVTMLVGRYVGQRWYVQLLKVHDERSVILIPSKELVDACYEMIIKLHEQKLL